MSKDNGKVMSVTPASEWGVASEIKALPSGKVARLKRLNVLAMLQNDKDDVPSFLKMRVARSLSGGNAKQKAVEGIDDPGDAAETIIWLAKKVFVYPKIVDEPQAEDEISIDVVELEDMLFAAGYGLGDAGVVQQLETFRREASGDVEPVSARADVEPEAEPDS